MTSKIPAAIEEAAAFVALATANAAEADHALAEAHATRERVAERVAALESERAAIQARRRAGRGDEDKDGGRLEIISLDIDDIKPILDDATRAVTPFQRAADEARRTVAAAEHALAHERDEELLRRLVARADQLAALLGETIEHIEPHKHRRGSSRTIWAPPPALADRIRKLDLARV